jgi:hypothetical protein
MMKNDRKIYEQVNAIQEYVRQHLEAQFEGYRSTELVAEVKSRYAQPLHGLLEDPDFIMESSVAQFYAFLESNACPNHVLRCWALLGEEGKVSAGPLEHITRTKRRR